MLSLVPGILYDAPGCDELRFGEFLRPSAHSHTWTPQHWNHTWTHTHTEIYHLGMK